MNRCLNENEINYVISHLEMTFNLDSVKSIIKYKSLPEGEVSIYFCPHEGGLSISNIQNTPIPFTSGKDNFYSIDEKGNLIFHQDLLKCAFYLLSAYDEHFINKQRDHWGRVKYEGSIQKKMEIIDRPVVNEYFDIIFNGINEFLTFHKKEVLSKTKIFKSFGFLLSHDVDVIDKYGWHHLGFKIKEFLGLVKSDHSKWKILKALIISKIQFVNPWRSNPYWNFKYLMQQEKKNDIKASYYFLSKDKKGGSRYHFSESRLKKLFKELNSNGHEIGIHGTTQTRDDINKLISEIQYLSKHAEKDILGGRQHRLWLDLPKTFHHHEKAGLNYDSSFGFAEHEGFRNSYCLPFKPYDFEKQKGIDVWQFPLMIMDVTLLRYRKLEKEQLYKSIENITEQVKKHQGILTLLWHNSFFDETLYPGITKIYETVLASISKQQPLALTGEKLVEKLDEQLQ